jgi:UPF0716 protein FxsA
MRFTQTGLHIPNFATYRGNRTCTGPLCRYTGDGKGAGNKPGSEVGGSGVSQGEGACITAPTDLEGARAMPVLLVLFAATIVELTVLIAVGHAIGFLATIGLLILMSLVGAALLRHEGRRTLAAFVEALRTRRPPQRELLDGMLIAAAGVLIVLPGFVSDVLGLFLLLPPTRALVRQRVLRSAALRTPVHFVPGAVVEGMVEGEVINEWPAPRSSNGELR